MALSTLADAGNCPVLGPQGNWGVSHVKFANMTLICQRSKA